MKSTLLSSLSMLLVMSSGLTTAAIAAPLPQIVQQKQAGISLTTVTRQAETLYLNKDQSYEYNLRLNANATVNGIALPAGSIVRGSFEPATGGLQYVATGVEVGDRIYALNAASEVLHDRKDPRETGAGDILTDAGIGAAGGLILGEVLGDAGLLEILGGAAAGAIVGNVTAPLVVVVEPDTPIVLTTR